MNAFTFMPPGKFIQKQKFQSRIHWKSLATHTTNERSAKHCTVSLTLTYAHVTQKFCSWRSAQSSPGKRAARLCAMKQSLAVSALWAIEQSIVRDREAPRGR
jgi:hypothetical protein